MLICYPCPCCGRLVFSEPPGSYDICPVCYWEDDLVQLRFPYMRGANHVNLIEAQHNYQAYGACEPRWCAFVRPAAADEPLESSWRRLDPARDALEDPAPGVDLGATYPADLTRLYYWRETYWKLAQHPPAPPKEPA